MVTTDAILEMSAAGRSEAANHYRIFVERALKKGLESPLQKVRGGMILGGKEFAREALKKVEYQRAANIETSYRKDVTTDLGMEEIIAACCEHFGIGREEMMRSKSGESRRACILLIKKHTSATNPEVAKLFGTLTYSAVAKIYAAASKQMLLDKELQEHVERIQTEYSFSEG
jgi:ABC-type uncharacterized transport system ATPase component